MFGILQSEIHLRPNLVMQLNSFAILFAEQVDLLLNHNSFKWKYPFFLFVTYFFFTILMLSLFPFSQGFAHFYLNVLYLSTKKNNKNVSNIFCKLCTKTISAKRKILSSRTCENAKKRFYTRIGILFKASKTYVWIICTTFVSLLFLNTI